MGTLISGFQEAMMPRGPKGEKRPANVIGNAVHVMRIATAEIDENLCRAELSQGERAKLTAVRQDIWETRFPETKAPKMGGAFRGNQHKTEVTPNLVETNFVTATAKAIGKGETRCYNL
jgi:hypothetical protein